ncbi:MAG: DUF2071 domain-containing protein [Verrucomicrobiales bacterium]
MLLPRIKGIIRRRILVNFRADPGTVSKFLPQPFKPKLHSGQAIVGICLIRLEQVRPVGMPLCLGMSSENAAHRIAVEWNDEQGVKREGVYIQRRDTDSTLNRLLGGRVFPGEHHPAAFKVSDVAGEIDFKMKSLDGSAEVQLLASAASSLPPESCFHSVDESSHFFEGGSLGYSPLHGKTRLQGLRLKTDHWLVKPLHAVNVKSSFFHDPEKFPSGSVTYDHALIMRDIRHEWHAAHDLDAS